MLLLCFFLFGEADSQSLQDFDFLVCTDVEKFIFIKQLWMLNDFSIGWEMISFEHPPLVTVTWNPRTDPEEQIPKFGNHHLKFRFHLFSLGGFESILWLCFADDFCAKFQLVS